MGILPEKGPLWVQSSQNVKQVVWEFHETQTDSVIHVLWLTNRDNQNKQFVNLRDWNSSSNRARPVHVAIPENWAVGGWCFLSEIYALRRVSLPNSITCHSQVMFWLFGVISVLINWIAVLWIQRKAELKRDRFDWAYKRRHETWVDGVSQGKYTDWKVMAMQCWFRFEEEFC